MLIDASVALKFFLHEEDSDQARSLIGSCTLCAPEIVLAETANGLWKARRRGILDVATYHAALMLLPSIFDNIHPTQPLVEQAGLLAEEFDHPVYDCLYLAAAVVTDDELVTADRRLLDRVAGTRFETRCFALADSLT